jgi:cytochrome c553
MQLKQLSNYTIILILVMIFLVLFFGCESPSESKFNAPDDHTVSKDGAKHKSGLNNPIENCASCHGDDLLGGSTGVSCYDCHGEKW